MPSTVRRRSPVLLLVSLAAVVSLLLAAPASATGPVSEPAPPWADAEDATITPGVQTYTEGSGQCTANFIYVAPAADDGTDEVAAPNIYIGQSAHCAGTGGSTATNGCQAGSQPLGTPVEIEGADYPGELAYSSWLTMQEVGETDSSTCRYNDFALVRIDPADHDKINPTVPFWGGPDGLNTGGTASGEDVYSYGNSSLRLGIQQLSPKRGFSLGTTANGWNHPVYTLTPGIPGDSGSAFLDATGNALGSLSTLAIAPLAGSNGVTDLNLALEYMHTRNDIAAEVALGTEPFQPGLPIGP